MKPSSERILWGILWIASVTVLVILFVTALGGCATVERAQIDAAVARIDSLEASLATISIGGGGDSVTSWIREVGWVVLWLSAMGYYPLVHRPIRKWKEKQKAGNETPAR